MRFITKLVYYIIAIPAGALFIALAVANRHGVSFRLDPINIGNPNLSFDLPLYLLLFAALFIGVLLGGFATWLSQGKWRRKARAEEREKRALSERQKKTAPQSGAFSGSAALPAPDGGLYQDRKAY